MEIKRHDSQAKCINPDGPERKKEKKLTYILRQLGQFNIDNILGKVIKVMLFFLKCDKDNLVI